MITAQQTGTFFRVVPLHDSAEHQECADLTLTEVPDLSESAVVGKVTPRSVRYDAGPESWFVDPRDKSIIRAYRKFRDARDIEAGAFPLLARYYDGKGPL